MLSAYAWYGFLWLNRLQWNRLRFHCLQSNRSWSKHSVEFLTVNIMAMFDLLTVTVFNRLQLNR